MIERVAKRLFEARGNDTSNRLIYGKPEITWEEALSAQYVQAAPEQCRRDARAAIEAMRVPTEAMCAAFNASDVARWEWVAFPKEWAKAIDAALAEGK